MRVHVRTRNAAGRSVLVAVVALALVGSLPLGGASSRSGGAAPALPGGGVPGGGGATAAEGDPGACDNGTNEANCEWRYWRSGITDPVTHQYPIGEVSPINADGATNCVMVGVGCGYFGTGPVAIGGNSTCVTWQGCGYFGTGPIAVAGDANCTVWLIPEAWGCGFAGTGPLAVLGSARCDSGWLGSAGDARGCGYLGTGPVAIGGDASCRATRGCGYLGTGPVSIGGDVSCQGTCGSRGTTEEGGGGSLPRRGTPGISATGSATCPREFDRNELLGAAGELDPVRALDHLERFECVSAREALLGQ